MGATERAAVGIERAAVSLYHLDQAAHHGKTLYFRVTPYFTMTDSKTDSKVIRRLEAHTFVEVQTVAKGVKGLFGRISMWWQGYERPDSKQTLAKRIHQVVSAHILAVTAPILGGEIPFDLTRYRKMLGNLDHSLSTNGGLLTTSFRDLDAFEETVHKFQFEKTVINYQKDFPILTRNATVLCSIVDGLGLGGDIYRKLTALVQSRATGKDLDDAALTKFIADGQEIIRKGARQQLERLPMKLLDDPTRRVFNRCLNDNLQIVFDAASPEERNIRIAEFREKFPKLIKITAERILECHLPQWINQELPRRRKVNHRPWEADPQLAGALEMFKTHSAVLFADKDFKSCVDASCDLLRTIYRIWPTRRPLSEIPKVPLPTRSVIPAKA